jgi:hypothetical protein
LISATGNITGNCFIGNGSQLTALPVPTVAQDITSTGDMSIMTYDGNLKYVSYATIEPASGNVKSAGSISATGNITGGNIRTAGLISATSTITSASNITGGNLSAVNLVINNITSDDSSFVTIKDGVNVDGEIVATGNITGSFFVGNGSLLTGLPATYSNSNVQAYLPTYSGNVDNITAVGNITVVNGIFSGNGAGLTGVVASGNVGAASQLTNGTSSFNIPTPNGNVVGNIGGVTNVYQFASTGLTVTGIVSATGNITGNFFVGNGSLLTGIATSSYGNANVAANLAAFGSNPVSTTGNVTAGYVIGNGSLLSSITGANVSGTVANATFATSAGSATTAGTVTDAAQPNITSVGILTAVNTSGAVSATGNITGGNLISNGNIAMLSNVARYTWVSNVAPTSGQGSIGDIWYQTV